MFPAFKISLSIALLATASPHLANRMEVLEAIRIVESRGRHDCPDGDGGRSIGPFQISYPYYLDALKFDPRIGGSYQDCRDRAFAKKVVCAYMERHVPEAWKSADAEVIARTHNGGPRGAANPSTLKYWETVKKALFELSRAREKPSP